MENIYFEHLRLQRSSVREGPLADSLHFDRKRFPLNSSLECISWQRPNTPLIINSLKGEKGHEPFLPKRMYSVLVCLGQSAFEWFCLDQQTKRERGVDGSSLSALFCSIFGGRIFILPSFKEKSCY